MAIKNTSFAKGEAVQKLIEVIARVNNKSVSDDAVLQNAINEVREMFKTDEMTEDIFENIVALQTSGGLEPGHMYKTEYEGATCIAIADSNSTFLQLGFIDGKAALIDWGNMSATLIEELGSGESIIPDSILHTMSYEQFCQMGSKQPGHFYALTDALAPDVPEDGRTLVVWNTTAMVGNDAVNGYNFFACYHDRPCIYDAKNQVIVKYLDGVDDFIGSNSVTSVANIPVNKSTVVATHATWADGTVPVSFAEGLPEGREVYCIIQNADSGNPYAFTFTNANVDSVVLNPGQRVEVSVINIAGTYYTRVGVDVASADVEEISAEEVAAKFA